MSNIILITNIKGLDRMIGTVFTSRNIKKKLQSMTQEINMFRVLYSDKLTRGQLLTHPKNHKCIMQTGCKCMLTLTLDK